MVKITKLYPRVAGLVLGALALSLCVSSKAWAQALPLFGVTGPALNRADIKQADLAARKLLGTKPVSPGSSESWAEPTTGNSGTVTMVRAYRQRGHDCRAVWWHDTYKDTTERTFLLNTCLIAGQWRLLS